MPLLQINGKQIQNIFKAQMKSIYAELLFLTTACICPAHIPSDFWLRNLSFLIFFFLFFFSCWLYWSTFMMVSTFF